MPRPQVLNFDGDGLTPLLSIRFGLVKSSHEHILCVRQIGIMQGRMEHSQPIPTGVPPPNRGVRPGFPRKRGEWAGV